MCLLDDVCLLGNEIVAPPTVSMFEHLSIRPANYKHGDSCYSSWKYDWKLSLAENGGKLAVLFSEICFKVEVNSLTPSQSNVTVLSITTPVQLTIRK